MRYDRSNPMDAVKREPSVRGVLAFGLAAAVALGAIGIWSEVRTTRVRAENVERVVAAAGLGPATAHPLGGGCGRARRLFRWETDSAVGTACAGPRDKVELREISRR
jgi:hypothetical protein